MSFRYFPMRMKFSEPPSRSEGIDVNGRVVDVLSYDAVTGEATVLVEREVADPAVTFQSEPTPDPEPEKQTCGYETENGPCGRTVSEPDERCWQHPR